MSAAPPPRAPCTRPFTEAAALSIANGAQDAPRAAAPPPRAPPPWAAAVTRAAGALSRANGAQDAPKAKPAPTPKKSAPKAESAPPKAKSATKATPEPTPKTTTFYAHQFGESERPILHPAWGGRWIDRASIADVIVVKELSIVETVRNDSAKRIPTDLLVAMLFGKRIANPGFCSQGRLGGGTSIKFQPLMRRQFSIFLTPRFRREHGSSASYIDRASNELGKACRTRMLDTEENARQLGERAMIINDLTEFSSFIRKLATLEREQNEQGKFRASAR